MGSGAPEIVTVGTLGLVGGAGDEGVAPEARMLKRGDVAYMMPCVELIKIKK